VNFHFVGSTSALYSYYPDCASYCVSKSVENKGITGCTLSHGGALQKQQE